MLSLARRLSGFAGWVKPGRALKDVFIWFFGVSPFGVKSSGLFYFIDFQAVARLMKNNLKKID